MPKAKQASATSLGFEIKLWQDGQESNFTTWWLTKVNLAICRIDAQIGHGDTSKTAVARVRVL